MSDITDTMTNAAGTALNGMSAYLIQFDDLLAQLAQMPPRNLVIPVIGVILLVLIFLQIRSVRQTDTSKHFTDPDDPYFDLSQFEDATMPASNAFPVATLVFVRGEGNLPKEIPLERRQVDGGQSNQWSIGRSYGASDKVIDSRRISRLHATIVDQDGHFVIQDEGSSGGTFITSSATRVRRQLEPLVPTPIQDSDIINFNSIAYRFELDRSEDYSDLSSPDVLDQTEAALDIDGLL